ncbi:TIGR04104 family putative zinc finger protein [Pseudalkalibacillus sp. R45]|uniref:TIGR04104 family putative zinc finger protein n=1 Tax=Pseudalkalibacillus sp. R45 TaxID=3457433 RepID=UPI003FCCC490
MKITAYLYVKISSGRCYILPKCDNCNTIFKWRKIFKANLFYSPIQCSKCNSVHKVAFLSRFTVTSLTVLPILIFGYYLSPFNNVIVTLIIGLCIAILGFLIAPFLVNYKEIKN